MTQLSSSPLDRSIALLKLMVISLIILLNVKLIKANNFEPPGNLVFIRAGRIYPAFPCPPAVPACPCPPGIPCTEDTYSRPSARIKCTTRGTYAGILARLRPHLVQTSSGKWDICPQPPWLFYGADGSISRYLPWRGL